MIIHIHIVFQKKIPFDPSTAKHFHINTRHKLTSQLSKKIPLIQQKNAAKAKPEESLAIDAADSTILTMDEVKKHCTKDDLWLIVKGRVYDVTNYVHLHQGGEAALEKFAGKEATDAVYGPQHPGTVPTLLEKYFVGTLEK